MTGTTSSRNTPPTPKNVGVRFVRPLYVEGLAGLYLENTGRALRSMWKLNLELNDVWKFNQARVGVECSGQRVEGLCHGFQAQKTDMSLENLEQNQCLGGEYGNVRTLGG